MITAEKAGKIADEFLENRIGESRRRVEKEISEAAARGEVVIHIGGPIPQELMAELRANGFTVDSSFYLNDTTYTISW